MQVAKPTTGPSSKFDCEPVNQQAKETAKKAKEELLERTFRKSNQRVARSGYFFLNFSY